MMNERECCLIVVDVQSKLSAAMEGADAAVRNIELLARGAEILQLPTIFTEQYPKGLGGTVAALRPFIKKRVEKTCFSAAASTAFLAELRALDNKRQYVLCGIEAHVCVLQTALDLSGEGDVFVVADAIASRTDANRQLALRSMASAPHIRVVSTEMVLFEWLSDASHPKFKEISGLVKQG